MSAESFPSTPSIALSFIVAVLAILSLITLLSGNRETGYLVLYCEGRESGSKATLLPLSKVYYDFTHSVNKSREVDVLSFEDGFLVLKGVYFRDYGAGVPASPEEVGGQELYEAYDFIYYDAERVLGEKLELRWPEAMRALVGGGGVWFDAWECKRASIRAISGPPGQP